MILIDDSIRLLTGAQLADAIEALPAWRREQAYRFRHESQQAQCAAAYHLLCRLLREAYGIDEAPAFRYNAHGKPELLFAHTPEAQSLHFSLSHCREAVAVVVDTQPVGIDVEVFGRYTDLLARHVFSPQELAALPTEAEERDRHFTLLWTQKEAVAKLTGTGLQGADTIRHLLTSGQHHIESHFAPHYVWSVARALPQP